MSFLEAVDTLDPKTIFCEIIHGLPCTPGYNLHFVTNVAEGAQSERSRHNSRSFLFRLPAEIHLLIFELRVNDIAGMSSPDREGWVQQSWIAEITHVCSRWRALALAHPRLWTDIHNFAHLPVADAMILRSGKRPLLVRIHLPPVESAPGSNNFRLIFTKLWRVLYRTRVLQLSGSPPLAEWLKRPSDFPFGYGYPELDDPLSNAKFYVSRAKDMDLFDAVQARSLEVIGMPSPILKTFWADTRPRVLFDVDIFGRRVPALQQIYLLGCNFTWDTGNVSPFSKLTSLTIGDLMKPVDATAASVIRLHVRETFSLLSTLPLLTRLEFAHIFKPFSSEDRVWHVTHQKPTRLPELRYLCLMASPLHCTTFLNHLEFPAELDLDLKFSSASSQCQAADCIAIFKSLKSRLNHLKSPRTLGIHLFRRVSSGPVAPSRRAATIYAGFDGAMASSRGHWLEGFPSSPFQISVDINLAKLNTLLRSLPLKRVYLVEILARWIEYPLWNSISTFPNLRKLYFSQVDWGYVYPASSATVTNFNPLAFITLASDRNSFKSLKTIVLDECHFPPSYSLSSSVPQDSTLWAVPSTAPLNQRVSNTEYASNIPYRLDDWTFDKHRLIQFLESRRTGSENSIQLKLFRSEELDEDVIARFKEAANTIVKKKRSDVVEAA